MSATPPPNPTAEPIAGPTLDPPLLAVAHAYRTCEFATVNRDGVPITWPVVTVRRADGTFLLTTSIALPQKAFNIRRDPRVALLFSDPTGSGIAGAPQLLLRGTAECPDRIVTGTAGAEEYWARLAARQPASRASRSTAPARWFMDWYYMRLHITVTPVAVTTRPSPGVLPPASTSSPACSGTAVLGTGDLGTGPRLIRVPVEADGTRMRVEVPDEVVDDGTVRPGPASLLVHAHDERLWDLRCALSFGSLERDAGTWTFATRRTVTVGQEGPLATLRTLRRLRRTAARYLEHRRLDRPRIAWPEFDAAEDG